MANILRLEFLGDPQASLYTTYFEPSNRDGRAPIVSRRGRSFAPITGSGVFRWTKAVRAVCATLVAYKYNCLVLGSPSLPCLSGYRPSLASSLDDALCKGPVWLLEMFGVSYEGVSNARRIFCVANSGGKLPGPIEIFVHKGFLDSANISILVDGCRVEEPCRLEHLSRHLKCEDYRKSFVANQGGIDPILCRASF